MLGQLRPLRRRRDRPLRGRFSRDAGLMSASQFRHGGVAEFLHSVQDRWRTRLGETVEADGGLVHLGHVQPLDNSRAELGGGTTLEELVKLDQKTSVRVLGLDHLGRALVPDTASASLQIDTHVFLVLNEIIDLSSVKGREKYEDDM